MTRVSMALWVKALALLPLLFTSHLLAQDFSQTQPALFVHSNDKFGMNLLRTVHDEARDSNIVIAPLPVSLTFAAFVDRSVDSKTVNEILSAFQWEGAHDLSAAGHMLHARFEMPRPQPHSAPSKPRKGDPHLRSGKREELWLSEAFLYRGEGSLSRGFINRVRHDFGFDFLAVGANTPQSAILAKNWDSSLPMPAVTGNNDFWITSFTHLRTAWAGNTFVEAIREKQDFRLRSGSIVQADFLTSELNLYPYVRTDEFDAVVLTCSEASILLVLPGQDKDFSQLEAALVSDPGMIESVLKRQVGDVQMPPFHFSYEGNLRKPLAKMGIHRIFDDTNALLSVAPSRSGGVLRGVAQKTEITVDENGIRADAGTISYGVFGGVMGNPPTPFHLVLNRPFLFIIRDNVTNALLFTGVVMNPNLP